MPDDTGPALGYLRSLFDSIDIHATGLPMLDAQADFRRARRAHAWARLGRRLRRKRRCQSPPSAAATVTRIGGVPRLKVLELRSIVGTVEPSPHFDCRFRPGSELLRARWERIALAHRKGIGLPPIVVREGPGGYYVLDGRHRVSVALALGHGDIDAWVTARAAS